MLTLLCVFCCSVASALYGFAGEPGGLAGIFDLVAAYLFSSSIALWVEADAAKRQAVVPYDLGAFIFFLSPIAAPVYLFRTRGWRGFGPIALFLLVQGLALFIEFLLTPRGIEPALAP